MYSGTKPGLNQSEVSRSDLGLDLEDGFLLVGVERFRFWLCVVVRA
jgi:hypothetical protein